MSVSTKNKPLGKTAAKPAELAVTEDSPVTEPQSAFERAIILRTMSMTTGSIATNWEQVLAAVEAKSKEYQDVTKYAGDEKQAKTDRALLRKQKDMTKTTIASIEEAWNEPLKSFLAGGKQILKQFNYAIEAIDDWVKEGEAREKETKHQEIQAYFDGKNFDLVSLDMFFDDRWLNKGYKLPDIKKEIDAKIAEIYSNIKILESIPGPSAIAKAFYLETLDMGAAMIKLQALKDNAERLAREQAEREQREHQAQIDRNRQEQQAEQRQAEKDERVHDLVSAALDLPAAAPSEIPVPPTIYSCTLRFFGTKEKLEALKAWMSQNGISYEKVQ